jgi:L-2,4-diaminobutyrate decarboxylase
MFEAQFFGDSTDSVANYKSWVDAIAQELIASYPEGPYNGGTPAELAEALRGEILPKAPVPMAELKQRLGQVIRESIAVSHPYTTAHLHTPVLLPALGAEMMISALNQSMDSFDQAPSATAIEELLCKFLCRLARLPASAAGTFTAGATQSNYMGLLLARDHFLSTSWNWNTKEQGLPPEASRLRIFCSEAAHFSVEKAAIQLGLGLQSVVRVKVDSQFRMSAEDLVQRLDSAQADGLAPFAIVATAGTTDFGSFDPIVTIANIAQGERAGRRARRQTNEKLERSGRARRVRCARVSPNRLWLHVDAAYGGAFLLSSKHCPKLDGLDRADSIAIDFHKAFFQPISCGVFLLADQARFDPIRLHAEYLNTEEREAEGIPDLVTRSVLTSRRFEALKLWTSFQAIGQEQFAAMIGRLAELAQFAGRRISALPDFEMLHEPEFGCVAFRYTGPQADAVNRAIPRSLFDNGRAVLGHTVVHDRPCLKLTFNNPCTTEKQVSGLLDLVEANARRAVLTAHG